MAGNGGRFKKNNTPWNKGTIGKTMGGRKRTLPGERTLSERNSFYLKYYKGLIFDHYGWRCNCCGETTPQFLCVDHVNNDGYKDKIGKCQKRITGLPLYRKIINEGYGEKYQILCANCNHGKNVNNGICPHKTI